jgi:hypothetical protein
MKSFSKLIKLILREDLLNGICVTFYVCLVEITIRINPLLCIRNTEDIKISLSSFMLISFKIVN